MKIGIVAVQGAFIEHGKMLDRLRIEHFEIRQKRDLATRFDGFILPGGESTVIGKLVRDLELFSPLAAMIQRGLPVFGTCAGLILLAETISNADVDYFGTMSLTVKRNAYGRQLGSFMSEGEILGIGSTPMVFIRAPYIEEVRGDVEVLSSLDGHIVAARQGNQLATAFHPELTEDLRVHRYFIEMVEKYRND